MRKTSICGELSVILHETSSIVLNYHQIVCDIITASVCDFQMIPGVILGRTFWRSAQLVLAVFHRITFSKHPESRREGCCWLVLSAAGPFSQNACRSIVLWYSEATVSDSVFVRLLNIIIS